MAEKETRRLRPAQITENNNALAALQVIEDYNPANEDFTVAAGTMLAGKMQTARTAEAQALAALKTARDKATAAEWAMHNFVLGVKDQVAAQYGKSSNEYQSLGLKKKTEYKRPHRQPA